MGPPFYHTFTVARQTQPDMASLVATLRNADATAGVQHVLGSNVYTIKSGSDWTPTRITAAQNILEAAPVATPQLLAQSVIDKWPIEMKALVLTLIDQLNVIRAALPTPLPAITPAQAIAAVRNKAATL